MEGRGTGESCSINDEMKNKKETRVSQTHDQQRCAFNCQITVGITLSDTTSRASRKREGEKTAFQALVQCLPAKSKKRRSYKCVLYKTLDWWHTDKQSHHAGSCEKHNKGFRNSSLDFSGKPCTTKKEKGVPTCFHKDSKTWRVWKSRWKTGLSSARRFSVVYNQAMVLHFRWKWQHPLLCCNRRK